MLSNFPSFFLFCCVYFIFSIIFYPKISRYGLSLSCLYCNPMLTLMYIRIISSPRYQRTPTPLVLYIVRFPIGQPLLPTYFFEGTNLVSIFTLSPPAVPYQPSLPFMFFSLTHQSETSNIFVPNYRSQTLMLPTV